MEKTIVEAKNYYPMSETETFGCGGDEDMPHSYANLNPKTGKIPCENCGKEI